jgi:hypothetical protein
MLSRAEFFILLSVFGTAVGGWFWKRATTRWANYRTARIAAEGAATAERAEVIEGVRFLLKEFVPKVNDALEHLRRETTDNGGSSMKDQGRALAAQLEALRIDLLFEREIRRATEGKAIWKGRTMPDGRVVCTYVSAEWIYLTGLSCEDCNDGGWTRWITREYYEEVVALAEHAGETHSVFVAEYVGANVRDQMRHRVRHTGLPVVDTTKPHRPVIGWIGEIVSIPQWERRGTPTHTPIPATQE